MSTFEVSTGTALPTRPGSGDRVGVVRSGTPYALDLGITDALYAAGGAAGTLQYNTGTGFGAATIGTGLAFAGGTLSLSYSYTLPVATATVLGGVKAGTGLAVAGDGTLSVTSSGYTLPVASPTTLGGVKVDNTSITVTASGVLSANTSGGVVLAVAGTDPVPLIDGTATVGTSGVAARENHVHPTDTSRAPIVAPSFTGGVNVSGGLTVSSNGLSITGGASILTGGLSIAGGLTISSGVFTLPQWTTTTRPSTTGLAAGSEGFATDTARRETWSGAAWVNYVRTTDLFGSSSAGIVGASGGGTSNFLRADGSWTAPSASGYGSPQLITVAGAATFDTTKALIVVNCTSGIVIGTLPNGTSDGQETQIAIWPTTQLHTIAATINGSSVTLAANSPNVGVSLNLKWSSSQTTWIIRNYDGGYKISDLTTASVVASGDKLGILAAADGKDYAATIPLIAAATAQNLPTWTTAGRPTLAAGQRATGYNTDLAKFDYGSNTGGTTTWNQHVDVASLAATSAQLLGGTGTNGVAQAITVGSGLTLTGTTLTSSGGSSVLLNSRPALSTLTWLNQSTSTANEISGGPIVITYPAAGLGAASGLEQTPPASPYTFTGRQTLTYPFTDTMTNGLYIRNSSSGTFTSVTQDYAKTSPNQGIGVYRYTGSGATFSSTLKAFTIVPGRVEFLRIVNNGTNFIYMCSIDGYAWLTMFTETIAAAGTPDKMGQYAIPFDSGTLNISALLTIREWSILGTATPQASALTAGV